MNEWVVRFCVGGAVVSVFSLCGEILKPRTFAGIFGAAPSVALASLALAFGGQGRPYVFDEAASMTFGALGFIAYAFFTKTLLDRSRWREWVVAAIGWIPWLVVTFATAALCRSISR